MNAQAPLSGGSTNVLNAPCLRIRSRRPLFLCVRCFRSFSGMSKTSNGFNLRAPSVPADEHDLPALVPCASTRRSCVRSHARRPLPRCLQTGLQGPRRASYGSEGVNKHMRAFSCSPGLTGNWGLEPTAPRVVAMVCLGHVQPCDSDWLNLIFVLTAER